MKARERRVAPAHRNMEVGGRKEGSSRAGAKRRSCGGYRPDPGPGPGGRDSSAVAVGMMDRDSSTEIRNVLGKFGGFSVI